VTGILSKENLKREGRHTEYMDLKRNASAEEGTPTSREKTSTLRSHNCHTSVMPTMVNVKKRRRRKSPHVNWEEERSPGGKRIQRLIASYD